MGRMPCEEGGNWGHASKSQRTADCQQQRLRERQETHSSSQSYCYLLLFVFFWMTAILIPRGGRVGSRSKERNHRQRESCFSNRLNNFPPMFLFRLRIFHLHSCCSLPFPPEASSTLFLQYHP